MCTLNFLFFRTSFPKISGECAYFSHLKIIFYIKTQYLYIHRIYDTLGKEFLLMKTICLLVPNELIYKNPCFTVLSLIKI